MSRTEGAVRSIRPYHIASVIPSARRALLQIRRHVLGTVDRVDQAIHIRRYLLCNWLHLR